MSPPSVLPTTQSQPNETPYVDHNILEKFLDKFDLSTKESIRACVKNAVIEGEKIHELIEEMSSKPGLFGTSFMGKQLSKEEQTQGRDLRKLMTTNGIRSAFEKFNRHLETTTGTMEKAEASDVTDWAEEVYKLHEDLDKTLEEILKTVNKENTGFQTLRTRNKQVWIQLAVGLISSLAVGVGAANVALNFINMKNKSGGATCTVVASTDPSTAPSSSSTG